MDSRQAWRARQIAERQALADATSAAQSGRLMEYGAVLPDHLRGAVRSISPTLPVPASAIFADDASTDIALLVSEIPPSLEPRRLRVAGELKSLSASPLALPAGLREAAQQTLEYRMGSFKPLLVSSAGDPRFLVPAFAYFFRSGALTALDLDPDVALDPDVNTHRLGNYIWSDTFDEEIIYVLTDLSTI